MKVVIGIFYLVGAFLLLPGFIWIIPEKILHIPVHFNPSTHVPDVFIYVPKFGDRYETAIHTLIWGISLILAAATMDMLANHCRAPAGGSKGIVAAVRRVFGPFMQVLGALAILGGCIVFLPKYALTNPPKKFNGISAPDLANDLFKLGSVLYFIAAIVGVLGVVTGIRMAKARGKAWWPLTLPLVAFLLFMCTSTCYFVNGMLPTSKGIEAGYLRLVGTICMVIAVVLLTISTAIEVVANSRSSGREVADCGASLSEHDFGNAASKNVPGA